MEHLVRLLICRARRVRGAIWLGAGPAFVLALGGCVASSEPAALPPPMEATCFTLPHALASTETKGLLNTDWTTRLERGPYVAEHTDAGGTYYRAPPGGVFYGRADGRAEASNWRFAYGPRDGGIYIPRDPTVPPHLYTYFSQADAEVSVPPDGADCSAVRYIADPVTHGGRYAVVIVEVPGKTQAHNEHGSTPHSIPVKSIAGNAVGNALGAAIAGEIVNGINNADIGNIRAEPELTDPRVLAEIRRLANAAAPLDRSQTGAALQTAMRAPTSLSAPAQAQSATPPPPGPVAATAPSAQRIQGPVRVPYLAEDKQQKFLEYLSKPKPRAFAISDNGHFASVWGETDANGIPVDAQARALERCRSAAGRDCFLFAVDDTVVFSGAPNAVE